MSSLDEEEYNQISEDWRHRDNLTWQIPSVVAAITGGLIVAAFSIDTMNTIIKPTLLGIGAALSLCLTFALAQNLYYQVASGEALIIIVNAKACKIPKNKMRRTLTPGDLNISTRDFIKKLFPRLVGSAFLFILCFLIALTSLGLFVDAVISLF